MNRRLVFDTSCISHFARASRLDVLERIADGRECIIPNEVATEIERGIDKFPVLRTIASQSWLRIVELDFPETRPPKLWSTSFLLPRCAYLSMGEVASRGPTRMNFL